MTTQLLRFASVLLPANDRPWLTAMISEAALIEGMGPRLEWLLGCLQFLALRSSGRIGWVGFAQITAFLTAMLGFTLAAISYEGLRLDDDVYLLTSVTLVGTGMVSLALRGRWRLETRRR